jgi:dolichol kinase
VGTRYGRTRLLGRKTLEGSAACFLTSLAVAAPLLRIGELGLGPIELLVGAAVAALAELACRQAEDDFLMPVAAAAMLTVLLWARAAVGS